MNNYTTNTDFLKETQKLLTFSNKFLVKDTEEFEELMEKIYG